MRFEIETVDGETLKVGGAPLLADDKMKEQYPEVVAAIAEHDKTMTGLTLAAASAQILKVYNPEIEVDKIQLDRYTCERICEIYNGEAFDDDDSQEGKKKDSVN